MSECIIKHNIKSKPELLNLAYQQKTEGKIDLALYVLNNIEKAVKIIHTTWEMETSTQTLRRQGISRMEIQGISRMEILESTRNVDCECLGEWPICALQTLQRNGIDKVEFANAVKTRLQQGRGKNRKIMIVGPANCGKTFILKPLCKIYRAFANPATGSFAWVGVEETEIIYLNDGQKKSFPGRTY